MTHRAVLFDLDGTLLDTLADVGGSMNLVLRQLGLPEPSLEAYKQYVGDGVECLVRRVLPAERCEPATVAQLGARMREEYGRHWADTTRPYEGVAELLDALTARGLPMAVLSNKPENFTQLCVTRLLPQWRFAAVVGQQPALARKPDPAGALEIARRLGVAPAEMLYLGDTNTDMQTATAAGMYPVGALWGFRSAEELLAHGARALAAHPRDVLPLL